MRGSPHWFFIANVCLPGSHTACFSQVAKPIFPTHQHLNMRPICPIHCLFIFQAAIFMMHIPEAVNLLLNTSLCVLVTHFISCVIEIAWDMWGIFHWWKKVFNKPHHHWLYGAIWWATNVFIWQLHSLIRYSLGKSTYKYGKTKFGELSAVIFHRDWSIVHIHHRSSGKSLSCSTWIPYISVQCPDMSLASSVKSGPPPLRGQILQRTLVLSSISNKSPAFWGLFCCCCFLCFVLFLTNSTKPFLGFPLHLPPFK